MLKIISVLSALAFISSVASAQTPISETYDEIRSDASTLLSALNQYDSNTVNLQNEDVIFELSTDPDWQNRLAERTDLEAGFSYQSGQYEVTWELVSLTMMVYNYSYMVVLGSVSDSVCEKTELILNQSDYTSEQELVDRLRTVNIAEGCIVFENGGMSVNAYFQRD